MGTGERNSKSKSIKTNATVTVGALIFIDFKHDLSYEIGVILFSRHAIMNWKILLNHRRCQLYYIAWGDLLSAEGNDIHTNNKHRLLYILEALGLKEKKTQKKIWKKYQQHISKCHADNLILYFIKNIIDRVESIIFYGGRIATPRHLSIKAPRACDSTLRINYCSRWGDLVAWCRQ